MPHPWADGDEIFLDIRDGKSPGLVSMLLVVRHPAGRVKSGIAPVEREAGDENR